MLKQANALAEGVLSIFPLPKQPVQLPPAARPAALLRA